MCDLKITNSTNETSEHNELDTFHPKEPYVSVRCDFVRSSLHVRCDLKSRTRPIRHLKMTNSTLSIKNSLTLHCVKVWLSQIVATCQVWSKNHELDQWDIWRWRTRYVPSKRALHCVRVWLSQMVATCHVWCKHHESIQHIIYTSWHID